MGRILWGTLFSGAWLWIGSTTVAQETPPHNVPIPVVLEAPSFNSTARIAIAPSEVLLTLSGEGTFGDDVVVLSPDPQTRGYQNSEPPAPTTSLPGQTGTVDVTYTEEFFDFGSLGSGFLSVASNVENLSVHLPLTGWLPFDPVYPEAIFDLLIGPEPGEDGEASVKVFVDITSDMTLVQSGPSVFNPSPFGNTAIEIPMELQFRVDSFLDLSDLGFEPFIQVVDDGLMSGPLTLTGGLSAETFDLNNDPYEISFDDLNFDFSPGPYPISGTFDFPFQVDGSEVPNPFTFDGEAQLALSYSLQDLDFSLEGVVPVPEPSSFLLFATALVVCASRFILRNGTSRNS